MAYRRLVLKITKENLWLYILKMLMERPMYAYEISKEIKVRFDFTAARVTVYVVLYKMQKESLIQLAREQPSIRRPARKYYEITEKGKETFLKGKEFLQGIIRVI